MILKPESLKESYLDYKGGSAFSTGFDCLDKHLKIAKGYLMVVSGYAGLGKSELVDVLLTNMGLLYGWRTLFYSPENYPFELHMQKLSERFIGKAWVDFTKKDKEDSFKFIQKHFAWIDSDQFLTLEKLLDAAATHNDEIGGLDCVVIDPWNQLNHTRSGMVHEYLSDALARLIHFGRRRNILMIVVAHPKNPEKLANGGYAVPGMYDISDGAMWRNKADYGIIFHRTDMETKHDKEGNAYTNLEVHIQKVKFKFMGKLGMVPMEYNLTNGRYRGKNEVSFYLPTEVQPPFPV